MINAFIFDMDGVIVDSEILWHQLRKVIWPDLVGKEVAKNFRVPVGMTPLNIYEEAIKHGSKVEKEKFLQTWDNIAFLVYNQSPLTPGLEILGRYLISHKYKIGLVSSSRKQWIETVLNRLSFKNKFECVISINDTPNLKSKPFPDAYLKAIKTLKAIPKTTIILEDSNSGIQAAKRAEAFTIGFMQNLLPEYMQHGADTYANSMEEVIEIVSKHKSF